jgi:hypothetical protein
MSTKKMRIVFFLIRQIISSCDMYNIQSLRRKLAKLKKLRLNRHLSRKRYNKRDNDQYLAKKMQFWFNDVATKVK